MKKPLAIFGLLPLAVSTQAQTIAAWNFDSLTLSPAFTNSTSLFGVPADVGSGTASGLHASSSAAFSTPAGNGSVKSISENNWAVGDYFQFQASTLTFSDIKVTFDETSSSTGPSSFALQYSTDGTTFVPFGSPFNVAVNGAPNTAWNSSNASSVFSFSFDLSSVPALDNAANVYFRLVDSSTTAENGGTVAAAGTDRIDNFTIASVPEPSSLLVTGGLGLLVWQFRRRR